MMITKITAFTTTIGNLFKTKEEVLRSERRDILGKFLTKETTVTEETHNIKDSYCSPFDCYRPKYKTTYTTKYVPDEKTIEAFLNNYDDIMIKLKEVDNASI